MRKNKRAMVQKPEPEDLRMKTAITAEEVRGLAAQVQVGDKIRWAQRLPHKEDNSDGDPQEPVSSGGGGQQGPDLQYPVCGAGRGKEEGEGQAEGNK